jgi:hypothetical protein
MAELPPLHQRIILDASGVPAAVAETTAGLEAIGGAANATTAELAGTRGMMASMFKGTALIAGIMLLAHEFKHMADETKALEVEQSRLSTVLANIKGATEEQKKSAEETAEAITKLGFAHSDATGAMATLVTATGSVSQAQKLMGLTADYARSKHMTLSEAALAMGRATQGNLKAFKAYGIALDTTLPKNQAIAKAFDQLNAKIGGTAKNSMNTFAVQLQIMRERFQEVANKIGAVLLPILTGLIKYLGQAFDWVNKNSSALKVFGIILEIVTVALKGFAIMEAIINGLNPFTYIIAGVIALAVAFVYLWNKFDWFRKGTTTGLSILIKYWGYLVGIVATTIRVLSYLPGMGFLKKVADQADKTAKSLGKVGDEVKKLQDKKMTPPKIDDFKFTAPGSKTGIKGNVLDPTKSGGAGAGGGAGGSTVVQNITVYASNTNDIEKQMAKAAKNGTPIGVK